MKAALSLIFGHGLQKQADLVMDKTLAALLGAVGTLAAVGPAHAAAQPIDQPVEAPANLADILHAASYADLLRPIPNAVEQLRALEQAELARPSDTARMLYEVQYHHHHHHHHHRYVRRHHHHHHVVARALNRILNR
jgi:hypothetical protein